MLCLIKDKNTLLCKKSVCEFWHGKSQKCACLELGEILDKLWSHESKNENSTDG